MIKNTLIILLGCLLFSTQLSAVSLSLANQQMAKFEKMKIEPQKGKPSSKAAEAFNKSLDGIISDLTEGSVKIIPDGEGVNQPVIEVGDKRVFLKTVTDNLTTVHDGIIAEGGGSSAKSRTLSFKVKRAIAGLKKSFAKLFGSKDKSEEAALDSIESPESLSPIAEPLGLPDPAESIEANISDLGKSIKKDLVNLEQSQNELSNVENATDKSPSNITSLKSKIDLAEKAIKDESERLAALQRLKSEPGDMTELSNLQAETAKFKVLKNLGTGLDSRITVAKIKDAFKEMYGADEAKWPDAYNKIIENRQSNMRVDMRELYEFYKKEKEKHEELQKSWDDKVDDATIAAQPADQPEFVSVTNGISGPDLNAVENTSVGEVLGSNASGGNTITDGDNAPPVKVEHGNSGEHEHNREHEIQPAIDEPHDD